MEELEVALDILGGLPERLGSRGSARLAENSRLLLLQGLSTSSVSGPHPHFPLASLRLQKGL